VLSEGFKMGTSPWISGGATFVEEAVVNASGQVTGAISNGTLRAGQAVTSDGTQTQIRRAQEDAVLNRRLRAGKNDNAVDADDQNTEGSIRYGMSVNTNYLARIVQDGRVVAKGFLPETIRVSVSSSFGMPFGQAISEKLNLAAKVLGGTTLVSQSMTMQVWEGTAPLELTIEMEFLAETDPKTEVIAPIQKLLQLVMPKKTSRTGRLEPPGPQLDWTKLMDDTQTEALSSVTGQQSEGNKFGDALRTAADSAKGKISVYLGNFMKFDNVVVENVDTTFHTMFDKNGLPLRATVALTFKTFMVLAQSDAPEEDDLTRLFNGHGTVTNTNGVI
jgi:hypothetical protein